MKTIDSLSLLVMFALLVLVGIITSSDLLGDASGSNDTAISQGADRAVHIVSPIFQIFGFGVLIIGIMIAINAYN